MKQVKVPSKPKYNRITRASKASRERYHYQYEFNER
jgi:hypothetical protein